jgi:hypothetical protein
MVIIMNDRGNKSHNIVNLLDEKSRERSTESTIHKICGKVVTFCLVSIGS